MSYFNRIKDRLKLGIASLWLNRQALLFAFAWVLFIVFFTYTTLVVELLRNDGDFCRLFYEEQTKYVALFVNIGIVIMLLFDNHVTNGRFQGFSYYLPLVAIMLCLAIKAHCDLNIGNNIKDYKYPISSEYLSIIAYCMFLFMLFILKVRSLWKGIIKKEL